MSAWLGFACGRFFTDTSCNTHSGSMPNLSLHILFRCIRFLHAFQDDCNFEQNLIFCHSKQHYLAMRHPPGGVFLARLCAMSPGCMCRFAAGCCSRSKPELLNKIYICWFADSNVTEVPNTTLNLRVFHFVTHMWQQWSYKINFCALVLRVTTT